MCFGDAQCLLEVVLRLVPLARGVRQAAKLQERVACDDATVRVWRLESKSGEEMG
tara:strand:- start:388 stop:552 length:165 start_codon:yes stop_codon:yes gene_type:complete